jgi:HD-GYP domain-containing protein (c-di-GMP phosphodiesterase class II)
MMNIFYAYTLMRRFLRMHKRLEEDEKKIKILNNLIRKDVTDLLRFVVTMIDKRDTYTGEHSKKVYEYSVQLGMALQIDEVEMSELKSASILHDIGKLGVSDSILMKPGKLTESEFDKIKLHPQIGAEILDKIADLRRIVDHVKHHHERIDGTGYPDGLKSHEISRVARIIAVADTYDALTSDRPYRQGMSSEKALAIMAEVKGTQLDGELVDLFSQTLRQMTDVPSVQP